MSCRPLHDPDKFEYISCAWPIRPNRFIRIYRKLSVPILSLVIL